jgi:hypothetical protein
MTIVKTQLLNNMQYYLFNKVKNLFFFCPIVKTFSNTTTSISQGNNRNTIVIRQQCSGKKARKHSSVRGETGRKVKFVRHRHFTFIRHTIARAGRYLLA